MTDLSTLGQVPILGTTRDPVTARLKVEDGNTALDLNRAFRAFQEFELVAGAELIIQIVSPINFDITGIVLSVDAGEVRYESISGATELTAFAPITTIFSKNTRSDAPIYTRVVTAGVGGIISGGLVLDVAKVKTGTNAQRFSIVEQAQGHRHVGAGTYYVRLTNTSNSQDASGIFYAHWDEV